MATATMLIGRRTELEAIEQVVGAARSGHCGVLVVRGVPGVGKTALLEHAADGASELRLLRAEGVEAESELAFAGLHQLLRPLTPLLGRLPPLQRAALEAAFGLAPGEAGDRFLAATAALALLAEAAEEQPVLCLVDDLQWLDRPSVDALVFVARRLEAEPVALLLAMRDSAPLPAGLQRSAVLELGGLEREAARELLEHSERLAPADRERVLEAAEGVPLALLELPRGPLAGGTSMSALELSFADRVAALPERTRRAVLLAAADDDRHARTRAAGAGGGGRSRRRRGGRAAVAGRRPACLPPSARPLGRLRARAVRGPRAGARRAGRGAAGARRRRPPRLAPRGRRHGAGRGRRRRARPLCRARPRAGRAGRGGSRARARRPPDGRRRAARATPGRRGGGGVARGRRRPRSRTRRGGAGGRRRRDRRRGRCRPRRDPRPAR